MTLEPHRTAEGIERINADATCTWIVPPPQQLSLLAMTANSVLAYLDDLDD